MACRQHIEFALFLYLYIASRYRVDVQIHAHLLGKVIHGVTENLTDCIKITRQMVSIRLPNALQAMPAKKSLLRIKKILDDYTYQPYPEYQSAKDIEDENQILPDTGVTVAQEKRWTKEQEGLLLRATDLYSPDVNYNQIEVD